LGYTDNQYFYGDPQVYPNIYKFLGNVERKHGGGTFGYLIRKRAAEYLVNKMETEGNYRAVDWFLIDQFSKLTCYIMIPTLVTSEPYGFKNQDSDVRK
jgi:GR25 family glycosyltransferase involved in LPS biosynthesis